MSQVLKGATIIHLTDNQLEGLLQSLVEEYNVVSYKDVLREINRRSQDKNTQAMQRYTFWMVILAGVAAVGTIASAVAAIIAVLKP